MNDPAEIKALRASRPPKRWRAAAELKLVAETALEVVISAIEKGAWPLTHWERACLSHGMTALQAGLYPLARIEAIKAVTPLELRAPDLLVPEPPPFGIDALRRALEQGRALPPRSYPGGG